MKLRQAKKILYSKWSGAKCRWIRKRSDRARLKGTAYMYIKNPRFVVAYYRVRKWDYLNTEKFNITPSPRLIREYNEKQKHGTE